MATTVACWSRAGGGAKLHRSACHPQPHSPPNPCRPPPLGPFLFPSPAAAAPSCALPRRLLIPPGSYPHGVLKWDEYVRTRWVQEMKWRGLRSQGGVRGNNGTSSNCNNQQVVLITFLSTCSCPPSPPSLFSSLLLLLFHNERFLRIIFKLRFSTIALFTQSRGVHSLRKIFRVCFFFL